MFYGPGPVTGPIEIPPEVYSSPYAPPAPEMKELPQINDAKVTGLRLQGTLAKALPPMKQAGSMTNVRQMEAEKFAAEMAYVFNISKQQEARSRAIARQMDKQMENAAQMRNKQAGRAGSSRSRSNARRAKGRSFNAAYHYGYDPRQAMR